MDSRGGNSLGERDSGMDSNKGNVNGVEGMEADSKNAQSMPTYSDLQPEAKAKDGTVVVMTSTTCETPVRQLKPLLDLGNALCQPSTIQYGRDVHQFVDEKKSSTSSTSLTMSLGLYNTKSVEPDTNGFSVYNMAGFSMNHFDPNSDQMKIPGTGPIRAKPRQLLPKQSPIQQVHRPDTPKQPQVHQLNHVEAPKEPPPQAPLRVARPPVEGRGRNQLLPRYWPRITDQELQQITAGDSNSTIVPLFEKMLSASDAGRIGRLVLPKACAEAYFPPISQPEGLPLTIQDVSGKNWIFQFRFWPNNNSRMYVLEGVTPCIQSMQLQAGDTVTFSRLEPEGKLVMGYRRAPSSLSSQENPGTSAGTTTSTPSNLMGNGSFDNFSSIAGLSGLLSQSVKNVETHTNGHFNLSDTGYGWYKPDKGGQRAKDGSLFNTLVASDKKKSKPTNVKTKQSITDTDESVEFRISWEEAQDLLRSPPNVSPRIVKIEGYDFEEFEEPPILGKRTIFTSKSSGPGEDQWAQCDDCGSWRKVPVDVFLPSRWVCADNVWDKDRNSCNSEQELDNEEIEFLVQHIKEVKKKEGIEPAKATEPASGLEALANAATAGESSTVSSSPAATTKHPRHRPGCTCIVCIQPPSGKGPKHKPTCNCNVCLTVKRRFKTLMMRRKKKQSEREAEHAARKKRPWTKEDNGEVSSCVKWPNDSYGCPEGISRQGSLVMAFPNALSRAPSFPAAAAGNRFPSNPALPIPYAPRSMSFVDELKGHIDLNIQPDRDEDPNRNAYRVSMMRLLQTASHPLESYLKEQGLTSLVGAQQMMLPAMGFARTMVEREADKHAINQPSTVLSSDRAQDDLHMSLAMPRFEMATD